MSPQNVAGTATLQNELKPLGLSCKIQGSPYAQHLPALDGIRGLAVLGVAASHLFMGNFGSRVGIVVGRVFAFGAVGVELFFLLSGFLITGILYDSLSDSRFFRKFYARRALRIFPLYYGVLAVFAIFAMVKSVTFHGELQSFALYLQNTYLIATPIVFYANSPILPLGHFWSLAVEEQFYLVWPLVVFLVRRRVALLCLCAIFFLVCPVVTFALLSRGVSFLTVNTSTFCNVDTLLAGAALALLLRSPSESIREMVLKMGPLLMLTGLAIPYLFNLVADWTDLAKHFSVRVNLGTALEHSAFAVGAFGLVATSLTKGFVQEVFNNRVMRFLGRYSYGIYVFHVILFSYMRQPLRSAIGGHLTQNKVIGGALTGVLIFAFTLIAAFCSYQLYEQPFLRLKKYFNYNSSPPADLPV